MLGSSCVVIAVTNSVSNQSTFIYTKVAPVYPLLGVFESFLMRTDHCVWEKMNAKSPAINSVFDYVRGSVADY